MHWSLDWIEGAYAAFNRRDAESLKALAHPDVEVLPLVIGVASVGPWEGHAGIERLVDEAEARWSRFVLTPLDVVADGQELVVQVLVETVAAGGSTEVAGNAVHRIATHDGKVRRLEAQRA